MAGTCEFYLAQAEVCAQAAQDTALPNLREKYLRAEAAWNTLAKREIDTRAAREKREAEKAAEASAADTVTH